MSDRRKYRKHAAKQKVEMVLASFRGDRSVGGICREHDISETLLRRWRDELVEAGGERFQDGQERSVDAEQRRQIAELERTLGRKTYELETVRKLLRGLGVRHRVARSCELVAAGYRPTVVARVARIGRQAIYRIPKTGPREARRAGPSTNATEAVADANRTDGYRMVTALVRHRLGRAVNRKRVLRVRSAQ